MNQGKAEGLLCQFGAHVADVIGLWRCFRRGFRPFLEGFLEGLGSLKGGLGPDVREVVI